jgi:hypothetical protein
VVKVHVVHSDELLSLAGIQVRSQPAPCAAAGNPGRGPRSWDSAGAFTVVGGAACRRCSSDCFLVKRQTSAGKHPP